MDSQKEAQLLEFARDYEFSQEDLDRNGFYTKLVKAAVLRDLDEGKCPARYNATGLPFNFLKSENLIWAFRDVSCYEEKIHREYVGGSSGVSVRIAKGISYRVGSHRGTPVESSEIALIDSGIMAVTTKHVYFQGQKKAFRIRFNKIVSITPYSDGVGIQRDAISAKQQLFITEDGLYTYNLSTSVANQFQ